MTVTALIVAAGKGERLGGDMPKQYRPIGGKPVLRWAVEAMVHHPAIDAVRIVIGVGPGGACATPLSAGWMSANSLTGGAERSDSRPQRPAGDRRRRRSRSRRGTPLLPACGDRPACLRALEVATAPFRCSPVADTLAQWRQHARRASRSSASFACRPHKRST